MIQYTIYRYETKYTLQIYYFPKLLNYDYSETNKLNDIMIFQYTFFR